MDLTRESILKMKPGLELDALVAEKVMKLEVVDGYVFREETVPCPENKCGCFSGAYTTIKAYPVLHYSTDNVAAGQVVEEIVSRMEADNPHFEWEGPLFKPENQYLENYAQGTTCWYVLVVRNGLRQHVCADTAPEAICKAALLAVLKAI